MNSATAAKLRMIIARYFGVEPDRIVKQTRFRDLGADWVDLIELCMVIDNELLGLQTYKLVVGQIETVADLLIALVDLSVRTKVLSAC